MGPAGQQIGNAIEDEFLVYDSSDLRVILRKDRFVRVRHFNVTDSIWTITTVTPNAVDSLLVALLPCLSGIIAKIFERMKLIYRDENSVIWLSLQHENIDHGINARKYFLHGTNPLIVADNAVKSLENYLKSNQQTNLESFKIQV